MSYPRRVYHVHGVANQILQVSLGPLQLGDWLESVYLHTPVAPAVGGLSFHIAMSRRGLSGTTTLAAWIAQVTSFSFTPAIAYPYPASNIPFSVPLWHKIDSENPFLSLLTVSTAALSLVICARLRPAFRQ